MTDIRHPLHHVNVTKAFSQFWCYDSEMRRNESLVKFTPPFFLWSHFLSFACGFRTHACKQLAKCYYNPPDVPHKIPEFPHKVILFSNYQFYQITSVFDPLSVYFSFIFGLVFLYHLWSTFNQFLVDLWSVVFVNISPMLASEIPESLQSHFILKLPVLLNYSFVSL